MSGKIEEIELKDCCSNHNPICLVEIMGPIQGVVHELEGVDVNASRRHGFKAKILDVLNQTGSAFPAEENWHIRFPFPENRHLKEIKARGISALYPNETIFIMDSENISYTITYHVEGKHKIFIYSHCPDSVETVDAGQNYIFIASTLFSLKNRVLYGNIEYGLYPDTLEMLEKINVILGRREP
jgi:hypothetical protein